MKKAFTLVELMICVAILGIVAAITLPMFQSNMSGAKEAAAKDNLRILRNAIEVYAAKVGVPPGYIDDNPANTVDNAKGLRTILTVTNHYLSAMPQNPFNNNWTVSLLNNQEQFPSEATGDVGWIYQPATKNIRLDWPGTDSKGIRYFDY